VVSFYVYEWERDRSVIILSGDAEARVRVSLH
jgi:hypothetical protein